jgi:two-component system chemotaxis response regulator CheB
MGDGAYWQGDLRIRGEELLEIKCPGCGGPLWEERQGRIVEYRCRVGHAFSPLALAEEHRDTAEKALWTSPIILESAALAAEKIEAELGPQSAKIAAFRRQQAKGLRSMLERLEPADD